MRERPIVMTQVDARMLRALLASRAAGSVGKDRAGPDKQCLDELHGEVDRATVLDPVEMPANVVTMRSRVRLIDLGTGERHEFVLVYPNEADVRESRVSVLAPLGTAVLGYREGDEVEWIMPSGLRRLRIERVMPTC
jgi:regulator of nucleoside diphosphate kinase